MLGTFTVHPIGWGPSTSAGIKDSCFPEQSREQSRTDGHDPEEIVGLLLNKARLHRVISGLSCFVPALFTALTWALEVADPQRFSSIGHAVSYCGLTSAFRSSAGKEQRGPISKQRNAWLQTVLIEAAKLAPRWNPQLAMLHAKELALGHPNRATLQVARKLVAYLLAVDKTGQPFQVLTPPPNGRKRHEDKNKKASFDDQSRLAADLLSLRSVSDPPAGPRVIRDCARELPLPIHPIVCFEVGRFALTQSSWPTLTQRCSRKWMSGHAAYALVLLEDRGQLGTQTCFTRRENTFRQVVGNLRFPLTVTYHGCPETSRHNISCAKFYLRHTGMLSTNLNTNFNRT